MSGGSKNQTTTTRVEIPEDVKPLLTGYLSRAQGLSNAPASNQMMRNAANWYGTQTVNAMDAGNAATQGLLGVAGGEGYNSNPYFDATVDKAMGDVTRNYQQAVAPGIDATAARAGAFGGSRWAQNQAEGQRQLGEALGNTANQMRSSNYDAERQRQMQAYGLLPQVGQAGQAAVHNMYGMGSQIHNEQANQLGLLGNAINIGMGGAGTASTAPNPNYVSPFQAAGSVGGLLLGGPIGGAIGGTLGGLFG